MVVVFDPFLQSKAEPKVPLLVADPYPSYGPTKAEFAAWTDDKFSPEIIMYDAASRSSRIQKAVDLARQRKRPVVAILAKNTGRTIDSIDVRAVRELREVAPDIEVLFLKVLRHYGKETFESDMRLILRKENISTLDVHAVVINITDGNLSDFRDTQEGIALLKDL